MQDVFYPLSRPTGKTKQIGPSVARLTSFAYRAVERETGEIKAAPAGIKKPLRLLLRTT